MPTQLPVEIIGRIIQLVYHSSSKRKAILPLLLVSPTFRIETERLLYSHICLRTLSQVVRCFQTINARPNIPRTIRQLHISISLDSTLPDFSLFDFLSMNGAVQGGEQALRMRNARAAKYTGKVLRSFAVLVNRTLNKLVSLQEYSLSLGRPYGREELPFAPMWLPTQAPFKLRRFIVDLNLSPHMTRFLQSQPSITDLLAPQFSHQPGRLPLPQGALPKLRGLVVTPEVASLIVPGRPVKRVVLKSSTRQGPTRIIEGIVNAIPALAQSTIPVKSLDIVVPQMPATADLLLKPLAVGLPHLEHLTLRRAFILPSENVYDVYESEAFTAPLADFQHLKTLQLPAPPPYYHLREAGIMNEMIDPFAGAPITIHANINGQIFAGPAPAPPPVVFGPPLPPNFANPNGNDDNNGDEAGGHGAGGGVGGAVGGFFAIPLGGGGLFGGGILPPIHAGQQPPAGNGGNLPPPPAAGPGAGALPGFFQNLFGLGQQPPVNQNDNAANPPNPNGNGNAAALGAPLEPPAPAQDQAPGPDVANFDELMDDGADGEVVADFFVVTAGPMAGDEGENGDENDADLAGEQPEPQEENDDPAAQPGAANAGPLPPPPPLFNLNQVLNQATNLIMQQLQNHIQAQFGGINGLHVGGPGGVPNPAPAAANANANPAPTANANPLPGLAAATTPGEFDPDTELPDLEPLAGPHPAGGAATPPPPPGPAPPVNFQTTFVTAWNPDTGEMMMDAGGAGDPHDTRPPSARRDFKDPKVIEILDKGQRSLKGRELEILDKWKLGGFAPGLKSVVFDMDAVVRRRTIWTWKESASTAPQPTGSRFTTVSSGDEDGDVQIHNADEGTVEASSDVGGKWEVEYVDKGVYNL